LHKQIGTGELNEDQECVVMETYKDFTRQEKLPTELVKDFTQTRAEAHQKWIEAREQNDFTIFLPYLEKIVELSRKKAEIYGYEDSPYDALLEGYEPGMTSAQLDVIFGELRDFLIEFLSQLNSDKPEIGVQGDFPLHLQTKLNEEIARTIGFDFESGRLDVSHHPFTTHFHTHDVRMTTRYDEKDLLYAIGSTIHEAGHAMYEQGLPSEYFGTPRAEAASLAMHESQSRIWETQIGRSRAFWEYFLPILQKQFPQPYAHISLDEFLQHYNWVRPHLIRTESDEVTYNLHIILRFEIEKALIEGKIEARELPEIWAEKMQKYLGLDVPSDAQGVLQDIHWSSGLFGYFPTYTLGNLYAAQLFAKMKDELPEIEDQMRNGEFCTILSWLRKKIHTYGRKHSAAEIMKKATGQEPSAQAFINYIKNKYNA
jgi:carboxypeptidase Taq